VVAMNEFVIVIFVLIAQFIKVQLKHFGLLKINHREGQHIVRFSIHRIKKGGPDILIVNMVLKILILGLNPAQNAYEKQNQKYSHGEKVRMVTG
jgi:hypothetical protein